MKRFALLLLFACTLAMPPLMTIAAAAPSDGPFVVIHPPWVDGGAAVLRAGGQRVGLSDTKLTTLAAARDPDAFMAQIRSDGIGLVVAADRLPFLCSDQSASRQGSVARRDPPRPL
jgi:hypothetical protein